MIINKPEKSQYPPFYQTYVERYTHDLDILHALDTQKQEFITFDKSLSDKQDYAYAEGKWTIKELLGHIMDTERIMAVRALCIARGDKTMLPGFDEKEYVAGAGFGSRDFSDMLMEFKLLRDSTIAMFKGISGDSYRNVGNVNGSQMIMSAMPYIVLGHLAHHVEVIKERYI